MATEKKGIHFALAPRQAMWKTFDGSIALSIFPNEKGKARTTGYVETEDTVNYETVMRGIRTGVLIELKSAPEQSMQKVEVIDLTNKKSEETMALEKATLLMKMSAENAIRSINTVNDAAILRMAMKLEKSGKNAVRKPRPTIIAAITARLDSISGIEESVEKDGEIIAEVSEGQGKGVIKGTPSAE